MELLLFEDRQLVDVHVACLEMCHVRIDLFLFELSVEVGEARAGLALLVRHRLILSGLFRLQRTLLFFLLIVLLVW